MFLVALLFSLNSFSRDTVGYTGEPQPLPAATRPEKLEGVKIDEKLGAQLDMNLRFKNEKGEVVTLGSFFDGEKPVIISPVYYSCPGLCNYHLNGLTEGFKGMEWSIGEKFTVLSISFDHKETPDLAVKKKENYIKVYNRPGTENSWHFLTGDQETIKALTSSIGFNFRWLEKEKEWAHASAAVVASPKGTVTRYLPGILFDPKDLKLAVLEASRGKIGTFVDQLVLYCFQYNPHQSKYTLYATRVMKAGGGIMVLILAIWLLPFWYRVRRHPSSVRSS
jgi:protein SCO1